MHNNERLVLASEMLKNLYSIHENLILLKSEVEDISGGIFAQVYKLSLEELIEEQKKFESNSQEIHSLNTTAIKLINNWHQWSNNQVNQAHLLYPLRYYIQKKKIKKVISSINEQIFKKTIENRLIREKVASWEIEVKRQAENNLKESDPYKNLHQLLSDKDILVQDLTFLLSSLPEFPSIDNPEISSILKALNNLHVESNCWKESSLTYKEYV